MFAESNDGILTNLLEERRLSYSLPITYDDNRISLRLGQGDEYGVCTWGKLKHAIRIPDPEPRYESNV